MIKGLGIMLLMLMDLISLDRLDLSWGFGWNAIPAAMERNLVLRYDFTRDTGDRIVDRSPKKNDGIAHGARFTAAGKHGGALQFDGIDDYVDAGNPPSLQLTAGFTLSAWVKPEWNGNSFGIITKSQAYPLQDQRAIEFMLGHDYSLGGYFWNESTRFFAGVVQDNPIPGGTWTHVVMLHDPSLPSYQMRVFINGVEHPMNFDYRTVASIPVVRNIAVPMRIGCLTPGNQSFHGKIDDVMIFNRPLKTAEINWLYRR